MKKLASALLVMLVLSCQDQHIYMNDSYTVYPDKVVQGDYVAEVISPSMIVSDFGGDTLVWECKNDLSAFPACPEDRVRFGQHEQNCE